MFTKKFEKFSIYAHETISNDLYVALKEKLIKVPYFRIDPTGETFIKEYKIQLCIAIFALLFGLIYTYVITNYVVNQFGELVFSIIQFVLFFAVPYSLYHFFKYSSDYAFYIWEKRYYFIDMRQAIVESQSYADFTHKFYDKKNFPNYYKMFDLEKDAIQKEIEIAYRKKCCNLTHF